MTDICVVHLVRYGNSPSALQTFVDSYQRYKAGEPHDLLIIFKGFKNEADKASIKSLLSGVEHLEFDISDEGFDIDAYWTVYSAFQGEYKFFVFLNSNSEILKSNWLKSFSTYVRQPGVGIVGATGSYQSMSSDCRYPRFLENTDFSVWRTVRRIVGRSILWVYRFIHFASFPNPHIRSNAFMISSNLMGKITVKRIKNKIDAYYFESGRNSLTRQIQKMGLKTLLVGADNHAYDVEEWYLGNVFWRHDQENLLIADNQTRAYAEGDLRQKAIYSNFAWKSEGCPDGKMVEASESSIENSEKRNEG